MFRHFFEDVFTSQRENDMDEVLSAIETSVTPKMNDILMKPYTYQEIVDVLSQMHHLKSPTLDGMLILFYHKCWDFIKSDFLAILLNIINSNIDPSLLNATHIYMIPKKKNMVSPSDFHLISLCNVSFKVVTKVITLRLKSILRGLIHINQLVFVPGRQFTDNALLTFGLFHMMKNNKANKDIFSLKFDMTKAYDRVDCPF